MVGQGRNRYETSALSKSSVQCEVCKKTFRRDHLIEHYRRLLEFNSYGQPINTFSRQYFRLNENKRKHTAFFFENKYSMTSMPNTTPRTDSSQMLNPFTIAKKQKTNPVITVIDDKEQLDNLSTSRPTNSNIEDPSLTRVDEKVKEDLVLPPAPISNIDSANINVIDNKEDSLNLPEPNHSDLITVIGDEDGNVNIPRPCSNSECVYV